MTTARHNFVRQVEETHAEILQVTMTTAHLLSIGYAAIADALVAIGGATVRLVVDPAGAVVTVPASALVAEQVDGRLMLTMTFAVPVSLTDTVQDHPCRVVYEPGSPSSERVVCDGRWIVRPHIEAA